MTATEACQVISSAREESIVVSTMGAMNALDALSPHPLTVACVPLMGGAASLGLGIALAQPNRRIIILDGDASLLMELGGLVSVAQAAPRNYFHFLFNNNVQFSGLGNLPTPAHTKTDFLGLAKASGYAATYAFETKQSLLSGLKSIFTGDAPAFIELKVASEEPKLGPQFPAIEMTDARFTRMGDELRRIRSSLGIQQEV